MIKNVVFDFGQVMVRFDPTYMVSVYVEDKADASLLESVIFDRLYWDRLDEGTITDEEVVTFCKERLPERLHKYVDDIYYNWIYNIPEIDGMAKLVDDIKRELGVKVFLLSNISTYFAAHSHEISCLSSFDACIFSAVCKKTKPHSEIFEYLCKTGGILPSETIFIDDLKRNIDGAEAYGIKGYIFDGDVQKLKEYLYETIKEGIPK